MLFYVIQLFQLLYTVQSDRVGSWPSMSQRASNTTSYKTIHGCPNMPDPTCIALSNRHTLITEMREQIKVGRIKQLLQRMECKNNGGDSRTSFWLSAAFF